MREFENKLNEEDIEGDSLEPKKFSLFYKTKVVEGTLELYLESVLNFTNDYHTAYYL